jgi:hypothetical protein
MAGGANSRSMYSAAATRSATLDEKLVSAKSPSLSPSPVKSKRSTAIRCCVSARLMLTAAFRSLEQVKQWANSAYAATSPSGGRLRRALSSAPWAAGKGDPLVPHGSSAPFTRSVVQVLVFATRAAGIGRGSFPGPSSTSIFRAAVG